jgi:hypothetical protein
VVGSIGAGGAGGGGGGGGAVVGRSILTLSAIALSVPLQFNTLIPTRKAFPAQISDLPDHQTAYCLQKTDW